MIDRHSRAALALTGFIALAGCAAGGPPTDARNQAVAPVDAAAPVQAPVAATTPEISPRLMKRVQTALRGDGLYTGRIDGIWGPKTQGAVRGYQQAHSLSGDGAIDSATLASLKIASASATPSHATATPVAAAQLPRVPND